MRHPVPARAVRPCSSSIPSRLTPRPVSAASSRSCRSAIMADRPVFDRLPLQLAAIFPAVPAEAWTAAIRRDLGDAADIGGAADALRGLAWDIGDGIRIPP